MIVSQADLDLILNGKIRRRVIQLPVRHGKFGERKRCPVRKGGAYRLRALPPYARHKTRAERQPTRARAVLHLFDLCQQPARTAAITVLDVERQDDTWVVRFNLGDQSTAFDRPVFLAKYGDYTMTPSKQSVPGDPEVMMPLAEDLARARAKARESRLSPERQVVVRAKGLVSPLEKSLSEMKARNRLRLILKQLDILTDELSVPEGATVPASDRAAAECPAAVEGEGRPRGTRSEVPLESAA